jgi:hypothetical protein
MSDREPIAWITKNGKHIPIFDEGPTEDEKKKDREIAESKKQADEKNKKFKDGDTPKVIDIKAIYTMKKIALDDSKDADYGQLSGTDVKDMLKGFHYEELFPGEGMWYKTGVNYGYDIRRK